MPEGYSTTTRDQRAPVATTARAATPAGVQLKQVAGGAGGYEAQSSMLTPVQRRQSVGARPSAPVQMHTSNTRNVQRLGETPENAAPSATPHRDAALEHVAANPITPGTDGSNAPVVLTGPTTYEAYVAHIKVTFAAELAEIATITEQLKQKDTEAQADDAKLKLDAQELNWYNHELVVMGRSIEELTAVQQQRNRALEAMKGYQGMTMEQLHAAATAIIAKYEDMSLVVKADKAKLEAIMYSSIELGGQVNPEGAGKVRMLYAGKIDNEENPRLVRLAESEGMQQAELAALAVKYRTWSKTFVRTELMTDSLHAEILFLRDLGADGCQIGVTPASLAEKLFERTQTGVPADEQIPFEEASQQQKLAIYKAMLAKARETNPAVNAALTAPAMQRPLGLPDDQPSPEPPPTS